MTLKHVFITGASGCVGHYIVSQCLENPNLHVHAMVRDPKKLTIQPSDPSRLTIHQGDMETIEALEPIIQKSHYIIHTATAWGGGDFAFTINVDKTKSMFHMANPSICERIIYFSTASILGKNHVPVSLAGQHGSGYIRSKYAAHEMIQTHPMKDRITTVFPTMVFGGNHSIPQSHITSGLIPNLKILKFIRYITVNGAFHFLHAEDIARVSIHLLLNPHEKDEYVLGNKSIDVKDALHIVAKMFNMNPLFRIHVPTSFIFFISKLFRIHIGPWEKYCITHPYMTYHTVSPDTFNLNTSFPTLESLITNIKALYNYSDT